MWNLCSISLIFFLYSANAELDDGIYLSSSGSLPSSMYKREASSENGNIANPIGNYIPSGIKPPFDIQAIQKCYEKTLVYFQDSGYFPGSGGQNGTRGKESSSYNFSSMMQNEQFRAIFEKCMEEEKPSSSSYKKREAGSGSGNLFENYFPSGYKPSFEPEKWKKCWEEASKVMQGYASGSSRGEGDKEEHGSIIQSEQFKEIFEKCMGGEKPSSSSYKKREAGSGSGNLFENYFPPGYKPSFEPEKWKKCWEEASKVMQGYASGSSRGEGDKEEHGSIIQSEQFKEIFEKCMGGEKPSSSSYKKREAGSGSGNLFENYFPSGYKPSFEPEKWKKCWEEASKVMQGYASGSSRGEGDKEEHGSIIQSEQFKEIFEKCMGGEKPSSSSYKKREAGSGSGNLFENYFPSGYKPSFEPEKWKKCWEEASKVMQGYASGSSRGEGDKEEHGSIIQSEQFKEIFEKCMGGEKPSSSSYKKREAGSGSGNLFENYFPSGYKPSFEPEKWKKCWEEASKVMQGYASGSSRGEGDKEEHGSIIQSEQFKEIFEKCMGGEKPSSSSYKKREAGSGSGNLFENYFPSGYKPSFEPEKWKKCWEEASKVMQGYASGSSRGEGDKEEHGSIIQSEQFKEIFEKCMGGEKPSSSSYKKREAGSGSGNLFENYFPSGYKPSFEPEKWKKCWEEASKVMQGYASGSSRGEGDKEEHGSIIQSEQFKEIFEKCMGGEKPSSSSYKKREADSGSGNLFENYFPSGYKPSFEPEKWKKCWEEASKVMQGYASGSSRGEGDKEEHGSIIQSEQFKEIFEKCMGGEKPSSSSYKKREAGSGSGNLFENYFPSGYKPSFEPEKWKKCWEEASKVMQGYASGSSRGEGDKEEHGSIIQSEQFKEIFEKCMGGEKPSSSSYKKREAGSGSGNLFENYFPSGYKPSFEPEKWKKCWEEASKVMQGYASGSSRGEGDKEEHGSIIQSEQFKEIFEKCMGGEKPSSSSYKKREAGSGSGNLFENYFPSGYKPSFEPEKWKKCWEEASKVMQGYASGSSRGEGDKEEHGSIIQSEQFKEIFEKCMGGEKPSSSSYKKREAGSGSGNLFENYFPSGYKPSFEPEKWKKCWEEASKVMQGYASGSSRGEGDKEEHGSIIQSEQFKEIFEKCMGGEKPSSSSYKKREAGSGSGNLFENYFPSGYKPSFEPEKWKKCWEEASKVMQGYASGSSRGEGDKEEHGSIIQSEQFKEIFEKCMGGEKPSSSSYKKREADSGSGNLFENYFPSGYKPSFEPEKWKKCWEEASKVMQGYASGSSRGEGDKEEHGSIIQSEQFKEIFEKCMGGEKPSSSSYKKREAGSGSGNLFENYFPSGYKPSFEPEKWKKCWEEASKVMQGYASGSSRGEGDKEEHGSIIQSEQFKEIFEKCMGGEKPSSSSYKKREIHLKQRIKKSACNGDKSERDKVLRHISLFY